ACLPLHRDETGPGPFRSEIPSRVPAGPTAMTIAPGRWSQSSHPGVTVDAHRAGADDRICQDGESRENSWRAWDSLIRAEISLIRRFEFPVMPIQFLVPMRRELPPYPLIKLIDSASLLAIGGSGEQNSLYFPS